MIRDDAAIQFYSCISGGGSAVKLGGGLDDPIRFMLELSALEADPETVGALMLVREKPLNLVLDDVKFLCRVAPIKTAVRIGGTLDDVTTVVFEASAFDAQRIIGLRERSLLTVITAAG
jgi:hypothetical protein